MKKILAVIATMAVIFSLPMGCSKKESVFIGGVKDLDNKKIGVQEGTTGDILASDIKGVKMSRFKKAVDAAVDLKNMKIDAVILDEQPAKKIVENNSSLMILNENFTNEDYAIAVKKGNAALLNKINSTLARIKTDGNYNKFIDAYIPASGTKKALANRSTTNYSETITMGTNAEFEPFEYKDGQKIVGFDIEVANEIANDLKKNLKIENLDFDSLIPALSTGKVDFVIAGMTVTDERKQNVDFSNTYYTSKQVIIVRKTSEKK